MSRRLGTILHGVAVLVTALAGGGILVLGGVIVYGLGLAAYYASRKAGK